MGPRPGPMLVAVGGIHGNEPAGAVALTQIVEGLERDNLLLRGDVVALAGNLTALRAGKRFIDRDLNRRFDSAEHTSASVEDLERRDLLAALDDAFAAARGPVVVLDLHTTSGDGAPFAVFADTMVSRNFARRFPVPVVLGLEEQLETTLVDYVGLLGHVAVGFEGGRHADPKSVDNLIHIVWIALESLGLVARTTGSGRRELEEATEKVPRILEVTYRHAIAPADDFRMSQGFRSFQPVRQDEIVARDARGEVAAPEDGYLLMPLYQPQGDDGFFVVRRVRVFWLWLSAALRYARAGRIAHWLPGVQRIVGEAHSVRVNRRIARWYSIELLHLLGFRQKEASGDTLVMERRAHDLP